MKATTTTYLWDEKLIGLDLVKQDMIGVQSIGCSILAIHSNKEKLVGIFIMEE